MDTVILIEGLSKSYRLGTLGNRTLYQDINRWWAKVRGRPDPIQKVEEYNANNRFGEFIWALRDINLKVNQGEILGIIGRNGAGKSTLLKIISRITAPSSGQVKIKGRIASLLEVGTGFHPELTGRENIFLNGTILGMSKAEIMKKFDDIVSFAEIEKFIDTPVKRYSSGMYVRLAFAVAAHLEPEILLLDEVLAVGDMQFQKKCLAKMQDVTSKEKRTVLFVSHNMPMVSSLCENCILLENGRIKNIGKSSDVILSYYNDSVNSPCFFDYTLSNRKVCDEYAMLISGSIRDMNDNFLSEVYIKQPFKVCMRYKICKDNDFNFLPNFHFFSSDGSYAFVAYPQKVLKHRERDSEFEVECKIPANFINDGVYSIGLALTSYTENTPYRVHFFEQNALYFNVKDELSDRPGYTGRIPGAVRPNFDWDVKRVL